MLIELLGIVTTSHVLVKLGVTKESGMKATTTQSVSVGVTCYTCYKCKQQLSIRERVNYEGQCEDCWANVATSIGSSKILRRAAMVKDAEGSKNKKRR